MKLKLQNRKFHTKLPVSVNIACVGSQIFKRFCSAYSYGLVGRAIAQRNTVGSYKGLPAFLEVFVEIQQRYHHLIVGLVKLLVTNDAHMRILGIRCLGTHASSVIEVVSLMIRYEMHVKHVYLSQSYFRLGRSVKELSEVLYSQKRSFTSYFI